jgi:hypothetical protein
MTPRNKTSPRTGREIHVGNQQVEGLTADELAEYGAMLAGGDDWEEAMEARRLEILRMVGRPCS